MAQVDLSGGIVPAAPAAAPPSGGGIDLSGGIVQAGVSQPAAPAQPVQPAGPNAIYTTPVVPTALEGSYSMHTPEGAVVPVRYSRVRQALDGGLLFSDQPTLQKYARDHAADPLDEDRVDQFIDKHPYLTTPLQYWKGMGHALIQTATSLDPTPTNRFATDLQLHAATPAHTWKEASGEMGEGAGEFISGEYLLGVLGKAGMLMKASEKLKTVTGLSSIIDKVPIIGKLIKIGESSVKQGTLAGTQTYLKTHDLGAAAKAAGLAAAAVPVAQTVGAGFSAVGTAFKGTGEAAAEAAAAREREVAEAVAARQREATENAAAHNKTVEGNIAARKNAEAAGVSQYGQEAREAARPALEQVNVSRDVPTQELKVTQPGGGPSLGTGKRVVTATGKLAQPQIDVEGTLGRMQDFTGAADRLEEHGQPIYDQFDTATGGKFRDLNAQVAKAQKGMYAGEEGAAENYRSGLEKMDKLIDETGGEMTPEMKAAGKALWRKQYALRDVGDVLDKSINRVPGGTEAGGEGVKVDGKAMMKRLQRLVTNYKGRARLDEVLGPGRLDTLEGIAQANQTPAGQKTFNEGLTTVGKELEKLAKADAAAAKLKAGAEAAVPKPEPKPVLGRTLKETTGASLAGSAGGLAAHAIGVPWYWGIITAEGVYGGARLAMNAIKTNPKIAQNFLFALESGATPKRFGPLIATMIQKWQTEASAEKQQQQQPQESQP